MRARFAYVLEPVRQQRDWKLLAAQAHVAALQAELAGCELQLQRLDARRTREAGVAAQAWLKIRDPASKSAALAWLAQLQAQAAQARQQTDRVRAELSLAREECTRRQRDLEALERHRAEALRAHRGQMERSSAAQADADWCARLPSGQEGP